MADLLVPDYEVAFTEEAAIEDLARVLHWKMEHLDPSDNWNWDVLSDFDREFYRQCVKAILGKKTLVRRAIEWRELANNNRVGGGRG